jgi:predicted ATPase
MEKLIVRNFGSIRDVEIELKDLTLFIGETGTGKSTLAKLIAIFRDSEFWRDKLTDENFRIKLAYYQLNNFLGMDTFIQYQLDDVEYIYTHNEIQENYSTVLFKEIEKISNNENEEVIHRIIKETAEFYFENTLYIPAERGVASVLSLHYASLDRKEIIKYFHEPLLDFTGEFNKSSIILKKLAIDIFNIDYEKIDGKDYIVLPNGDKLPLSESASGLQATIPAILIFEYYSKDKEDSKKEDHKKSYIFEEPELNLFPIAQKLLVEFLAEKVLGRGHKLVITTHSPYILTAFNNLIQAGNAGRNQKVISKVSEIMAREKWLQYNSVIVYLIADGFSKLLMDDESQLIDATPIDTVSEQVGEEFDLLMELKYHG